MTTLRELLDAEDQAWRELCARFDRIDGDDWEQPGATGDWTPKDVLAHIAVWHALTTDRLECLRVKAELPEPPDVDAFNAEQVERNRDLSLHDARVMFGACRHRFREEVGALEEPLPERIAQIVAANGHGHYAEHLPELDAFLGRVRA